MDFECLFKKPLQPLINPYPTPQTTPEHGFDNCSNDCTSCMISKDATLCTGDPFSGSGLDDWISKDFDLITPLNSDTEDPLLSWPSGGELDKYFANMSNDDSVYWDAAEFEDKLLSPGDIMLSSAAKPKPIQIKQEKVSPSSPFLWIHFFLNWRYVPSLST